MEFKKTEIEGPLIIKPKIWKDERGYFYESYNQELFSREGILASFVQDNQSLSQKGAVRGLHGQTRPYAQGKLVRVIQGRVMDIAVDIRKHSVTYGQAVAVELSGDNHTLFWIPEGFLHGFATLEDNTIFTYKVTALYNKASEIGVIWNDPELKIDWGISSGQVILSEKDKQLPLFKDFKSPF